MNKKLGIIGYGSMGRMFINKFITSKTLNKVFLSNRSREKLFQIKDDRIIICNSNSELSEKCEIIFICVKPLEVKDVLEEIKETLNENKHIICTAGSLKIKNIEKIFSGKITRIMPTVISEINECITLACHNSKIFEKDKLIVEELFKPFSEINNIPEEEFTFISELTSCAPGIIAEIFREYTKVALEYTNIDNSGLNKIVTKTLFGTSKLFFEKGYSFDETIERVAMKGGTSEKGIKVLEEKIPGIFKEMFCKMSESQKIRENKLDEQYHI